MNIHTFAVITKLQARVVASVSDTLLTILQGYEFYSKRSNKAAFAYKVIERVRQKLVSGRATNTQFVFNKGLRINRRLLFSRVELAVSEFGII